MERVYVYLYSFVCLLMRQNIGFNIYCKHTKINKSIFSSKTKKNPGPQKYFMDKMMSADGLNVNGIFESMLQKVFNFFQNVCMLAHE